MAKELQSTTKEVFKTLDESTGKAALMIEKNNKKIINLFFAIVVAFVGWYLYNKYYLEPHQNKAINELSFPMQYFQNQQYELAISGDGQYFGFKDISEKYSGTKTADLANFYAGLSYEATNKTDLAIESLENISSTDNDFMAVTYGKIGDLYATQNKLDEALKNYEKATNHTDLDIKSKLIYKTAITAFELNQFSTAETYFKQYISDFSKGTHANDAKKYLQRIHWQTKS